MVRWKWRGKRAGFGDTNLIPIHQANWDSLSLNGTRFAIPNLFNNVHELLRNVALTPRSKGQRNLTTCSSKGESVVWEGSEGDPRRVEMALTSSSN